jgi:predicted acyltransferase
VDTQPFSQNQQCGLFLIAPAKTRPGRLVSLDAFRGFIMLMLVSHGFGIYAFGNHPQFSWLASQFEHAQWEGLTFWDLIQPAFMFMVGVAIHFHWRDDFTGDSVWLSFDNVVWRSLMLILLSQVLMSVSDGHLPSVDQCALPNWADLLLFLIMQLPFRFQTVAAVLVLLFIDALCAVSRLRVLFRGLTILSQD